MQATPTATSVTSDFRKPQTNRLAYRFFWKECRRIVGLSLGIAAIAIAVMLGLTLVGPASSRPAQMMVVAFGGAAMLAIAAAITLFAVEKEEGTSDLLRTLPKNNLGLLLGKCTAAVLSVLALLAALSLVGYVVAGGWPSGSDVNLILAQGTIVLAEALAFGILASLICPYPLIAAVLGIVLASLNSQLAVLLFVPSSHGYEVGALQSALPARWAFVTGVAAINAWLGMRWLPANPRGGGHTRARTSDHTATTRKLRRSWLASFVRLVWQSVRQSWGIALAVAILGVCLSVVFALVISLFAESVSSRAPIGVLGLLFTPALLGAMVFRADQRRGQYRFLSEHAGRPYTLWVARILTWLAPTLTIVGVVCFAAVGFGIYAIQSDYQNSWLWYNSRVGVIDTAEVMGAQLESEHARQNIVRVAILFFSAAFTAFSYGQFFSIALKSEILAAMLSLALSILVAGWTITVGLAGLSTLWFLIPLGMGAVLASWLRVRDWMLDRHGITRWALPLVALLLPIGFAVQAIPATRLAQIPDLSSVPIGTGTPNYYDIVSRADQELGRGRDVADDYQRLASQLDDNDSESVLSNEEFAELIALTKVTCRLPSAYLQHGERSNAIESLQFALLTRGQEQEVDDGGQWQLGEQPPVTKENKITDLDQRISGILACRRLAVQQSNGQTLTNALYPGYLSEELLDWATADGQTAERILDAIVELQAIERSYLGPAGRLANECHRIRSIVRGETSPSFLSRREVNRNAKPSLDEWLAFLANDLPGESERAERSLAVLAAFWTLYLQDTGERLLSETSSSTDASSTAWRQRVMHRHRPHAASFMLAATERPPQYGIGLRHRAEVFRRAQTSYLVNQEFAPPWHVSQSVDEWVSATAWWRAERVRLALIAFKLENGSYPQTLEELSPDFMEPWNYRDPFSTEPFGYSSSGFSHRTRETWMHSHGTQVPVIPPGTPVLWSSGTGEAKPTVARVRYEEEDGSRVEIEITESDSDAETEDSEPVMVLRPQLRSWGSRHFWVPLPQLN